MRRLLPLVLLCSVFQPVVASTYHVAQRHPHASDDNAGTPKQPWKTISKAAETLEPGDVVIVHSGVYRERVRPGRSGTELHPITYATADREEVVISGADIVSGWSFVGGGIWKKADWMPALLFRLPPSSPRWVLKNSWISFLVLSI